jgi:hypothetical protein
MCTLAPLLRSAILAIALSGALAAQAREKPAVVDPSNSLDRPVTEQQAQLIFKFDGQVMNDTRAASIAAASGFDLVSWQPCPSTANCMNLQVRSRQQGWIFRYLLIGETCRPKITGLTKPGLTDMIDRPSSPTIHAKATPMSDRKAAAVTARTAPTALAAGHASSCFGGYTAILRARLHNSYTSNYTGYLARFEAIYQTMSDGKWTPFASSIVADWRVPSATTSGTEVGNGYSWRDGAGKEVKADSSLVLATPSSGDISGASVAELCGGQKDARRTSMIQADGKSWAACNLLPIIPDSITIGAEGVIKGAPGGVGGDISVNGEVTVNVDLCAINEASDMRDIEKTAAAEYLDCLQHPARFFPELFTPPPRMVKKLMRPHRRSISGAPRAVHDTESVLDAPSLG